MKDSEAQIFGKTEDKHKALEQYARIQKGMDDITCSMCSLRISWLFLDKPSTRAHLD